MKDGEAIVDQLSAGRVEPFIFVLINSECFPAFGREAGEDLFAQDFRLKSVQHQFLSLCCEGLPCVCEFAS